MLAEVLFFRAHPHSKHEMSAKRAINLFPAAIYYRLGLAAASFIYLFALASWGLLFAALSLHFKLPPPHLGRGSSSSSIIGTPTVAGQRLIGLVMLKSELLDLRMEYKLNTSKYKKCIS